METARMQTGANNRYGIEQCVEMSHRTGETFDAGSDSELQTRPSNRMALIQPKLIRLNRSNRMQVRLNQPVSVEPDNGTRDRARFVNNQNYSDCDGSVWKAMTSV